MEQLYRPQFVGETPEENFRQLTDYLYQLTEQLEFILDNIGEDNLSPTFANQLNALGMDIDANASKTAEAQSQIGSLDIITVSDVINSPMFAAAINSVKQDVLPDEGSGYILFPGGTLICYGTANGDTNFAKEFGSIPKVIGQTTEAFTVSTTGITTTETFDFIAIGEEA